MNLWRFGEIDIIEMIKRGSVPRGKNPCPQKVGMVGWEIINQDVLGIS
jgi:hypothetical protein